MLYVVPSGLLCAMRYQVPLLMMFYLFIYLLMSLANQLLVLFYTFLELLISVSLSQIEQKKANVSTDFHCNDLTGSQWLQQGIGFNTDPIV